MADARAEALEFKQKGNAAFVAKNYDEAIEWFSKAIEKDASDHVFFSNRSACYLSKGDKDAALADAEKCVGIKPDWGKGYSRKGAALQALGRYADAIAAFEEGLQVEPANAALKQGLASAQAEQSRGEQGEQDPMGMLGAMFGPQLIPKLAANPKFKEYLEDPSFLAMLGEVQRDPNKLGSYIGDKRMQAVLGEVMGVQIQTPGGMEEEDESAASPGAGAAAGQTVPEPEPEPAPEAEPETEEEREERLQREAEEREARERRAKADEIKGRGNAAYKAKRFDEAIALYNEALTVDPENATLLNNRAAAEFEKGDFDTCVTTCKQALERAGGDFHTKAKSHARVGSALLKQGDLDGAVKAFKDSLLEAPSKAVERKLKQTQQQKAKREKEEYLNPELALAAKERGNELFKSGQFPQAIEQYTEAIKRDPGNAVYYQNRSAAFTKLMDFGNALDDCKKALQIDPAFVKAWGRKGQIETFLKTYHKAMDSFKEGLRLDPNDPVCQQGLQSIMAKMHDNDPERAKRAMEDPEIQAIMSDPVVRKVLEDMQTDPQATSRALQDPTVGAKLERLIVAGVLRTG